MPNIINLWQLPHHTHTHTQMTVLLCTCLYTVYKPNQRLSNQRKLQGEWIEAADWNCFNRLIIDMSRGCKSIRKVKDMDMDMDMYRTGVMPLRRRGMIDTLYYSAQYPWRLYFLYNWDLECTQILRLEQEMVLPCLGTSDSTAGDDGILHPAPWGFSLCKVESLWRWDL
mgnify:CR=1 FL=1